MCVNGFIIIYIFKTASCVDQGWKSFKSTCYKYFDQVGKERGQAKSHCQSFTSNLVMFKNADEQKFVINDVLPTHYGRVWIGLSRDSANKTVWRWDDGPPSDLCPMAAS